MSWGIFHWARYDSYGILNTQLIQILILENKIGRITVTQGWLPPNITQQESTSQTMKEVFQKSK